MRMHCPQMFWKPVLHQMQRPRLSRMAQLAGFQMQRPWMLLQSTRQTASLIVHRPVQSLKQPGTQATQLPDTRLYWAQFCWGFTHAPNPSLSRSLQPVRGLVYWMHSPPTMVASPLPQLRQSPVSLSQLAHWGDTVIQNRPQVEGTCRSGQSIFSQIPWELGHDPRTQVIHLRVGMWKLMQSTGMSMQFLPTRYWVMLQTMTLRVHTPLARSQSLRQVRQAPVVALKLPQRGDTSKQVLLVLYCLVPQITMMRSHCPLEIMLLLALQVRQCPVKASQASHSSLTGKHCPKLKYYRSGQVSLNMQLPLTRKQSPKQEMQLPVAVSKLMQGKPGWLELDWEPLQGWKLAQQSVQSGLKGQRQVSEVNWMRTKLRLSEPMLATRTQQPWFRKVWVVYFRTWVTLSQEVLKSIAPSSSQGAPAMLQTLLASVVACTWQSRRLSTKLVRLLSTGQIENSIGWLALAQISLATRSLKVSVCLQMEVAGNPLKGPPLLVKQCPTSIWKYCMVSGLIAAESAGMLVAVTLNLYLLLSTMSHCLTQNCSVVQPQTMLQKTLVGVDESVQTVRTREERDRVVPGVVKLNQMVVPFGRQPRVQEGMFLLQESKLQLYRVWDCPSTISSTITQAVKVTTLIQQRL